MSMSLSLQELIHADCRYVDDHEERHGSVVGVARESGYADVKTAAAIEIQRVFRGYLSR